jgi:hypothetical protein
VPPDNFEPALEFPNAPALYRAVFEASREAGITFDTTATL